VKATQAAVARASAATKRKTSVVGQDAGLTAERLVELGCDGLKPRGDLRVGSDQALGVGSGMGADRGAMSRLHVEFAA